ncbi:MAG: nicotinamide mononucleotide transporter [Glaciecola sp.]|nr:nicotinamide mononucleotide transporter [Glaciecola sp.]
MLFSLLEVGAVLCALAYMVLVAREHIACWFFAFVSTALFTVVFFEAALSFSMALNIYYMVMAGYGYWQWQQGTTGGSEPALSVQPRPLRFHLWVIAAGSIISAVLIGFTSADWLNTNWLNTHWINALDIVMSVFSVLTTVMVAHKVYENWFYWMVINALAVIIYSASGLTVSAGLFVVYILFAIYGWREWRGLVRVNASC